MKILLVFMSVMLGTALLYAAKLQDNPEMLAKSDYQSKYIPSAKWIFDRIEPEMAVTIVPRQVAENAPCKMPGRVRINGQCWLPELHKKVME